MNQATLFYVIETIFCSGVLWFFFRTVLSGQVSLTASRIFLLMSMTAAAVIPMLRIPVYAPDIIAYTSMPADTLATVAIRQSTESPVSILFIIYMAVVGLLSLNTICQIIRIIRLRISGDCQRCDGFAIIRNRCVKSPFSFFRTIFIGADFEDDLEKVIAHERSHIRHLHSLDMIVAEAINIALWFNPFVWMTKMSLVEIHEYQADKDVLDEGFDIIEYRTLIFRQAVGYNPDITNRLNNSLTKKRFIMMTKSHGSRYALLKTALVIPVVFALMALFSFTKKEAVIEVNESNTEVDSIVNNSTINVSISDDKTVAVVGYKDTLAGKVGIIFRSDDTDGKHKKPMIVIDGNIKDDYNLQQLTPDQIENVNVLKNEEAIKIYGSKASDGVIVISTKNRSEAISNGAGNDTQPQRSADGAKIEGNPLIIVDGVVKEYATLNDIDSDQVESMSVFKGDAAKQLYGRKGKNGVVIIISKDAKAKSDAAMKELERVQPEIDRAMQELEKVRPEIDRAMKEVEKVQPEIDRAIKEAERVKNQIHIEIKTQENPS